MKRMPSAILTSACLLVLSNAAQAQDAKPSEATPASSAALDEIIVTARRKEESLQDVPITVNVATAEDLNKLNIRNFADIQTIMPGLALAGTNVVNASSSVRGITFNQVVSGNNGVIEFYVNDSPLPASFVYQVMYDIGQIELLRGPQGTLRGRAAPAGSMTLTTRRPDLSEFGGYVNATATDIGGYNANGAVNIPIITDKLAIRLAGLYDKSEGDFVESVNNSQKPLSESKAGRATISFEPTDSLSFLASYQRLDTERRSYVQVENMHVLQPTLPNATVPGTIPASANATTPHNYLIRAEDRLSVQDVPSNPTTSTEIINLQAQWAFLGQKLNYVGSQNKFETIADDVLDSGDFWGPSSPAFLQGYGRATIGHVEGEAHELRLSSEEQLFGMLDYIVGGFYEQQESPTDFTSPTFYLIPATGTGTPGLAVYSPTNRRNYTKEQSYFANLTAHFSTGTEVSGGARHIDFTANSGLLSNGVPIAALTVNDKDSADIFMGSVKQKIGEDWMVYVLGGTSWRPRVTVVGDFNTKPSPREVSFQKLPPEESTSYELGVKATMLDKRMRVNLAVYHQTYENSPWRSPTPVYFANYPTPATVLPSASAFNLAGAVPVEVNGVEAEWAFAPNTSWDMSANASFAKSKIDNGFVPCNDYQPFDGVPDVTSTPPTITQIVAAAAPETITGCTVSYPASQSPEFSASAQSEYRFPLSASLNSYVRGLVSYYDDSPNDPTNPIDDVDSYALLNLYLGVRSSSGAWEVGLYGKNVADTMRVTSRSQTPLTAGYRVASSTAALQTAVPGSASTNYRTASVISPREFGVNVQYSFGSR